MYLIFQRDTITSPRMYILTQYISLKTGDSVRIYRSLYLVPKVDIYMYILTVPADHNECMESKYLKYLIRRGI